ncbi:hypothetical protein BV22DRAFT_1032479 [Leucogyrophana mollusca]|uniref:Uncharacterized protein n=1 Tax=Leucogyrophana mollusca TaxID=85980 RepID=A0ACB8BM90_9AGAM|nr:hypothetical protein BV22DRAFT_1032479 [Leucogyrophana mollusca]
MDDGIHPSADITRLHALRNHQKAWDSMTWSETGFIFMEQGHCWELCGGVLCQATGTGGLSCVQLPSRFRGIEEKRWTLANFGFNVRDFTIDPSQDLLVLLEATGLHQSFIVHLRSLSTGAPHSLAGGPTIIHSPCPLDTWKFAIQICRQRLGVLIQDSPIDNNDRELMVWDWKTSRLEMGIRGRDIQSFSFVSDDLILVAKVVPGHNGQSIPRLDILNVSQSESAILPSSGVDFICGLQYPSIKGEITELLVRSEPAPSWMPQQVPFFTSKKERLFVVTCSVATEGDEVSVLFVPLSTILAQAQAATGVPRSVVEWTNWGPGGTRMIARRPSETWVCYSFGMKFIHLLPWKKEPRARIYDFNPYTVNRGVSNAENGTPPVWKRLAKTQKINAQISFFEEDVVTSLPGRVGVVYLPITEPSRSWEAAMLSEDNVVAVSVG